MGEEPGILSEFPEGFVFSPRKRFFPAGEESELRFMASESRGRRGGAPLVLAGAVVVISVFFFFAPGLFSGSLVSADSFSLDSGERFISATFSVDRPASFLVYKRVLTGANGTVFTPRFQFAQVDVNPVGTTCTVNLRKQRTSTSIPGVPGFEYYYGDAPLKDVKYNLTVSKVDFTGKKSFAPSQVFSGASTIPQVVFSDPSDAQGSLKIIGLGFLQQYYECGSTSDVGIFVYPDTGVNRAVSLTSLKLADSDFNNWCIGNFNLLNCLRAIDAITKLPGPAGFATGYFSNPVLDLERNTLKYTLPRGGSGVAVVKLQGDLAFWDTIVGVKQETITPSIVGISAPTGLAGSSAGFSVGVRHDGSKTTSVRLTASPSDLVSPVTDSVSVEPGKVAYRSFLFRNPSTSSLASTAFKVQACVENEFGGTKCTEQIQFASTYPTPTPQIGIPTPSPPVQVSVCGNGKLEPGEDSQNCPQDAGIGVAPGSNQPGFGFPDWIGGLLVVAALILVGVFAFTGSGGVGELQETARLLFIPVLAVAIVFLVLSSIDLPLLGKPLAGLAFPIALIAGVYAFIQKL